MIKLITGKKGSGSKENGEIYSHECPKPWGHLVKIDHHKDNATGCPKEEMAEDMHHGI